MIKVCIVGCGKIADSHAWAIKQTQGAEIVGVCDNEELMARQLAERYEIRAAFSDLRTMIKTTNPNVIHITTPPQSHFEIGKTCLEAGCHVYIEKPFTLTSKDAAALIGLAESNHLKLTVGNDEQYSRVSINMRRLIRQGYLGGPPVHMDAYYCYDLGEERFAKVFLGNKSHWVRKLPGQLMQNIISHGLIKIVEYMAGNNIKVIAHGFTSNLLKKIGESDLKDELRVIIQDDRQTTAYFTFSTQMRPPLKELRIYGPKNGLIMSQDHHSLIRVPGAVQKSYLEKALPLCQAARQYRKNLFANIGLFIKKEFFLQQGLKNLTALFYRSIQEDSAVPIPYRDIFMTTKIMDDIFDQIYGSNCSEPNEL